MKHAGVSLVLDALRNEYCIMGVRRLAKSVKKKCKACKIQDAQACERPVAPLASMRVQPAAPFSTIGVDHTGVLYCHHLPGKKLHVLLISPFGVGQFVEFPRCVLGLASHGGSTRLDLGGVFGQCKGI